MIRASQVSAENILHGNTSEYLVIIVVIDGMKFQMSDHFIEHKKKQIHCEEETIHD